MMRSSCPQPMASPLCIFRAAGGRGKYGKQNRNQIQWAGPVSIYRAGPAYSCGFDRHKINFQIWINRKFFISKQTNHGRHGIIIVGSYFLHIT